MSTWDVPPESSAARPPMAYPPSAPSGALAWGLGLLIFICIPFASSVAAGIAMAVAGRRLRGQGEPGASNGRNAANWGLTYLLVTLVLVGLHFALVYALTRDEPVTDFFPLGIPITIWGMASIAHVVFSIVGLVRAGSQKVFWAPAIPFFHG